MNLYSVKYNFREAAGGLWIDEFTREEDEIKESMARGDAIVIEVAAGSDAITIHSLPPDDLAGFGSLAAWAAWQTSGREGNLDSMFYRVDVEPVAVAREFRKGLNLPSSIWISGPLQVCPEQAVNDEEVGDERDDGEAGGPVKARPGPGDEPPPPAQVRATRSR